MSYTGGSEFVEKLYSMLEEPQNKEFISWSIDGKSILIKKPEKIGENVLINYFRHGNLSTMIRQLNKYGFSKVKSTPYILKEFGNELLEFAHKNFLRGRKDLLHFIKRKKTINHRNCVVERTYAYHTIKNLINIQNESVMLIHSMNKTMNFLRDNVASLQDAIDYVPHSSFTAVALIYEDLKGRSTGLEYILNEYGYIPKILSNESEFFSYLYQYGCDLVILNITMGNIERLAFEVKNISPMSRLMIIKEEDLNEKENDLRNFIGIEFVKKSDLQTHLSITSAP